ncbi:MAG: ribosome recycling factor [Candidatus Wildermuthbacteria bacterium RIFCSPHIGHO2_02_FULL_49_9]|uniref:Ribosome recycling factor n=2 Tax=Candidatus Wildermuthiibacteriota TaxID=1817923 RepID=A0A1G2QW46_9BACT|nr:MAG: ribosome recycling factor [Candidatus Wildermuthbacteria bacterium RIFCSPHIGHO2_01_FULL_49_22b]OHA70100.1 MAG: ribosome recycling factor [Candidatus Wildermuthbacteria bacterium RIFCSPHIGHO2_02_FULL_49_9]
MVKQIIEKTKPELEKAVGFFGQELAKIRTGQASPALVEDIMVDVQGQTLALKQLAGISCLERRQILIAPWDPLYLGPIEKALFKAQLGVSPVVEGKVVRITLPSLTQEYRDVLLRLLSEKSEQAKQVLRKWRDVAWGEIQEEARKGVIRQDDKFKGKEDLQNLANQYAKKVDEAVERKKQEIER